MKGYLNASEVARLLRVDRATVTRWLKREVIKGAIRPAHTQQWRIPLEAYDQLIRRDQPGDAGDEGESAADAREDGGEP